MTLLEKLQSHKGGLIQIKSELYWYDDRCWDGVPGRIGLVLDAADATLGTGIDLGTATTGAPRYRAVAALLLVDGQPHWVWMVAEDIELLDGDHQ